MLNHRHISSDAWSQRLIAGAVVLFACVVFSPQQAQASCGDYVMIGGHANTDGTSAMASGHAGNGQSGKRTGFPVCHGPGCSERRDVPASPPTRITLDEHSWGWIPELITVTTDSWAFFAPSHHPVCAEFLAAGIFRPPRPVADV